MSEFGFWAQWGTPLSDARFANAWAALGCAAATPRQGGSAIRDALAATWDRARAQDQVLRWSFPTKAGAEALLRSDVGPDPEAWVALWSELASAAPRTTPRLRVSDAPAGEPIAPWLRILSEAVPPPAGASLLLPERPGRPHLEWPLRMGVLRSSDAACLARLERDAPVRIERAPRRCDLLVHLGDLESLLAELRAQPATTGAEVFVARGGLGAPWGHVDAALSAITRATSANGWVLLSDDTTNDDVARFLDALVARLAAATQIDVAVARSRDLGDRFDVVAGLTPALAAFRPPDRRIPKNGGTRSRGRAGPGSATAGEDARIGRPPGAEPPQVRAEPMPQAAPPAGSEAEHIEVQPRHLQQQSFVEGDGTWLEANGGFVAETRARVRVRIDAPDPAWDVHSEPFALHEVPPEAELTVWLTEPAHLPRGVRGTLKLRADGTTAPCDLEFRLRARPGPFEGRLTVLHAGRVIQTASLLAGVRRTGDPAAPDAAPRLRPVPVRRVGAGEKRQAFDLAFVLNHDAKGRPLSVTLSKESAWVADLTKSLAIAKQLNACLSPVAKSVQDYEGGPDGESGRALLVRLAQLGRKLHVFLVEEQLEAEGNQPQVADAEYLQIVSTRTDAVVPFEFVYDRKVPKDSAKVCERWRAALAEADAAGKPSAARACAVGCGRDTGDVVCPLAFWGLQKVIERHALAPQLARWGRDLYLQSEPERKGDTLVLGGAAVVGASNRVTKEPLDQLLAALEEHTGTAPQPAANWDAWQGVVHAVHPKLLIALPHTDRDGSEVTLEIGDETQKAVIFDESYVRPDAEDQRPLVALLGCDTTGTAEDYGEVVCMFRAAGAAIVLATIATVYGDHAATVARRVIETLLPAGASGPPRLGEALRAVKRRALLDGLFMPLCVVAYGDADWKLARAGGRP